jgi:D-cysteine desulfhydrase
VTRPRVELAARPTPLTRARRLEQTLGSGPIYLKRDDLTGFGTSGNKARALEFLLGAARADGADVLITAGSPSSNFCAAAAVGAAVVGLRCELLFPGPEPARPGPNVELARAAGATLSFDAAATREELDDAVTARAEVLRGVGHRPYPVPRGGATAIGALGYAHAAAELAEQFRAASIDVNTVVVATGSGGTQAGLVAGQVGFGLPWRVVGASVSRPAAEIADRILATARACAADLGLKLPEAGDVDVRDCRGAGFGTPSAEDRVSARLALTCEGLLLDDYYTAKTMTLLRELVAREPSSSFLFWHTGGLVAAIGAPDRGAPDRGAPDRGAFDGAVPA